MQQSAAKDGFNNIETHILLTHKDRFVIEGEFVSNRE